MLGYGDGALGIVIVPANLLHLQGPEHLAKDDIEQLYAVSIVDHGHQCDADGNLDSISGTNTCTRDSLGRKDR